MQHFEIKGVCFSTVTFKEKATKNKQNASPNFTRNIEILNNAQALPRIKVVQALSKEFAN